MSAQGYAPGVNKFFAIIVKTTTIGHNKIESKREDTLAKVTRLTWRAISELCHAQTHTTVLCVCVCVFVSLPHGSHSSIDRARGERLISGSPGQPRGPRHSMSEHQRNLENHKEYSNCQKTPLTIRTTMCANLFFFFLFLFVLLFFFPRFRFVLLVVSFFIFILFFLSLVVCLSFWFVFVILTVVYQRFFTFFPAVVKKSLMLG